MKSLLPLFLCSLLATGALAQASDEGAAHPPRSLVSRVLNPFGWGQAKADTSGGEKRTGWRDLTLAMTLDPQPLKLSETRQFKVAVLLANRSKRLVQLEFPTTQRIEVIVRNTAGKMIEQWSEDRVFTDIPGIISINPGERLEYTATVSTRDLAPSETYIVEAFFPKYEMLRVQRQIVPGK